MCTLGQANGGLFTAYSGMICRLFSPLACEVNIARGVITKCNMSLRNLVGGGEGGVHRRLPGGVAPDGRCFSAGVLVLERRYAPLRAALQRARRRDVARATSDGSVPPARIRSSSSTASALEPKRLSWADITAVHSVAACPPPLGAAPLTARAHSLAFASASLGTGARSAGDSDTFLKTPPGTSGSTRHVQRPPLRVSPDAARRRRLRARAATRARAGVGGAGWRAPGARGGRGDRPASCTSASC